MSRALENATQYATMSDAAMADIAAGINGTELEIASAQRFFAEIRQLAGWACAIEWPLTTSAVGVKPLDWEYIYGNTDAPVWRARKPFGSSYFIEGNASGKWLWMGELYDDLDAAKAAVWADYEPRIRSAILRAEEYLAAKE